MIFQKVTDEDNPALEAFVPRFSAKNVFLKVH